MRLLKDTDDRQQFDAFVAYANGDLNWVIDNMIPELEESRGYSLRLEDRDWLAGKPIVDNIMISIKSSRKILLIISPHFAADPWCEEMLMMAQNHLAGRARTNLIPVVLEEPRVEQLTPSLRALLTTHSCLYWPDNPRQETRFWKALNTAMKKRIKQTVPSQNTSDDQTAQVV